MPPPKTSKQAGRAAEGLVAAARAALVGKGGSADVDKLSALWLELAEKRHQALFQLSYVQVHGAAKQVEQTELQAMVEKLTEERNKRLSKERTMRSVLADLNARKLAVECKHSEAREKEIKQQHAAIATVQTFFAGMQQRLEACSQKREALALEQQKVNAAIMECAANKDSSDDDKDDEAAAAALSPAWDPSHAAEIEAYQAAGGRVNLPAEEKERLDMAMAEYRTKAETLKEDDAVIMRESLENDVLEREISSEMEQLSKDVSTMLSSIKASESVISAMESETQKLTARLSKLDSSLADQTNKLLTPLATSLDKLKQQGAGLDLLKEGLLKKLDKASAEPAPPSESSMFVEAVGEGEIGEGEGEGSVWRTVLSP